MKRTHALMLVVVAAASTLSASARASSYALTEVKAALQIGDTEVAALEAQGVRTTAQLYQRAAKPSDAKALAKGTKIDRKKLDRWLATCDLMRIAGIGPDVANLVTVVGVPTASALAKQQAAQLSEKIEKANAEKHLTENTPSERHLAAWIEAAKALTAAK
ncbi:MAG: DUF4332 domain-containing protein [Myxococcota bacterium]|mgnify:CR=1 FL=1